MKTVNNKSGDSEEVEVEKGETMEELRHKQLMTFMSSFKMSVETRFEQTNDKLDSKMEELSEEIKEINSRIEKNENETEKMMEKMSKRLEQLELEMKKSEELRGNREKLKKKEEEKIAARRLEEEKRKEKEKSRENVKDRVRRFERRTIREDDLRKDVQQEQLVYKSTWATQLEEELSRAARGTEEEVDPLSILLLTLEEEVQEVPDTWERLVTEKEKTKKIRKPVRVMNWMADEPSYSDMSSSVERKRRNQERQKTRNRKRRLRMRETAEKMRHTIGVGPIEDETIEYFEKETKDKSEALERSVREYLGFFLDFNQNELDKLEFLDVKRTGKDDLIYAVFKDTGTPREIHYRKAISGNDKLIIRDYIPPNFYARFSAIAKKAAEVRQRDKRTKTQIRWGEDDLEIFTKVRLDDHAGKQEPFKRQNLKDFMEDAELPKFDLEIKWERNEQKVRRKLDFVNRGAGLPSLGKQGEEGRTRGKSLVRQRSTQNSEELSKKPRKDNEEMEDDMEEDEDEDLNSPQARRNTLLEN